MSLFEAFVVTSAGLMTAYLIPIPAIKPFVFVILILLLFAAVSALLLLPAIYSTFVKMGWGLSGGSDAMRKNSNDSVVSLSMIATTHAAAAAAAAAAARRPHALKRPSL